MCDFTQGFKLCTCDIDVERNIKIDKTQPYWKLSRLADFSWMELEMGRCSYIHYSNDEDEIAEYICLFLDEGNCFDFNYHPQVHDVLNVFLPKNKNTNQSNIQYEFEFIDTNGKLKWQVSESLSDGLNEDKVTYQGQINPR